MPRVTRWTISLAGMALLLTGPALAQQSGLPLFSALPTREGGQEYSVKIDILILMTLLSLLPIMLLMMTCFTRFIIVLARYARLFARGCTCSLTMRFPTRRTCRS